MARVLAAASFCGGNQAAEISASRPLAASSYVDDRFGEA